MPEGDSQHVTNMEGYEPAPPEPPVVSVWTMAAAAQEKASDEKSATPEKEN